LDSLKEAKNRLDRISKLSFFEFIDIYLICKLFSIRYAQRKLTNDLIYHADRGLFFEIVFSPFTALLFNSLSSVLDLQLPYLVTLSLFFYCKFFGHFWSFCWIFESESKKI